MESLKDALGDPSQVGYSMSPKWALIKLGIDLLEEYILERPV